MHGHACVRGSYLALFAVLFAAGTASAQSHMTPDDHCAIGDATSLSRAFYPLLFNEGPKQNPATDGNETTLRCQFRSFRTPLEEICYCEHDVAFAGAAASVHTTSAAELRAGRAWLRGLTSTFTLTAPPGARAHGVSTAAAGVRIDEVSDDGPVRVVWTQNGVLFDELVPGFYSFDLFFHHRDEGLLGFNHNWFRVLPHETAHALGRPVSGYEGSVTCPLERTCSDGVDEDGDGATDCDDPNCHVAFREDDDPLNLSCFGGPFIELGSAVGSPVWTSSTAGHADDFVLPCTLDAGVAGDDTFRWTAPVAGTYTFDTLGSAIDSVISVSTGTANYCNEDVSGAIWQSSVSVPLRAGEEVVIIVDGYFYEEGPYVLNITPEG